VKPTGGKPPKAKTGLGHLVGYLPERGDFETEYDNDAEQILADMEFKEEDTKWETGTHRLTHLTNHQSLPHDTLLSISV
jgi:hypothetical protein